MLSVVVPCLIKSDKHLAMTLRCIETAKKGLDAEWVIVETGTNYLSEHADTHIFEKNKTTVTKSVNRGLKCCGSEYTVLLTNDVFVSDGWLEALIEPFKRFDNCGATTLGSTQFSHVKEDRIEEGIWASVLCMKTEYLKTLGYLDEEYKGSWDDTDLFMRIFLDGKKVYRNFNCIVEHTPGQTHYGDQEHISNYFKNREYFINKFQAHKEHWAYKMLV